mgnify:CR=1 FL=1
MATDLTVAAVPGYFATMGAEQWYLKRRARKRGAPAPSDFEKRDTIASLAMGVGSLVIPMLAPKVLNGATLTPEMQKKGVRLSRFVDPEITYHYWNLQDPVVGGLGKEKIALRRAMAMAYPVEEEIKVVRNGQAVEAQFPIPPGVVGHDPAYRSSVNFFLYTSAEFNDDHMLEGGLRLGYRTDRFDIAGYVRNITNDASAVGGIDFNNLTGFVNEPRIYGLEASIKF